MFANIPTAGGLQWAGQGVHVVPRVEGSSPFTTMLSAGKDQEWWLLAWTGAERLPADVGSSDS